MNRRFLFTLIFCGVIFANGHAQKIAAFEVELSNTSSGLEVPVKTDLNAITFLSDTALSLVKVDGDKRSAVPFQIEDGEQRTLYWLIRPGESQSGKHVFELMKGEPARSQSSMQTKAENGLLTIAMSCAGRSPVLLLEYRYGGLGWRATEQWHKDNSEVLTSEGKTRKDADGTRARWCIVQGAVDNDYAGVVMMSYPTNYNYPEPLRIWPVNQNGRGDMFANFSPTKNMDWLLDPGQRYVLKYRLIVFNGRFTKEKAESAWQNYAAAPQVMVKKK